MSFTIHYNNKPLKFVPTNGVWVCVLTDFQASHIRLNLVDQDFLDSPVDVLEINTRASNCLKAAGIFTIHQLIGKNEMDLCRLPNLGKGTLRDIIYALGRDGLTLAPEGETK